MQCINLGNSLRQSNMIQKTKCQKSIPHFLWRGHLQQVTSTHMSADLQTGKETFSLLKRFEKVWKVFPPSGETDVFGERLKSHDSCFVNCPRSIICITDWESPLLIVLCWGDGSGGGCLCRPGNCSPFSCISIQSRWERSALILWWNYLSRWERSL